MNKKPYSFVTFYLIAISFIVITILSFFSFHLFVVQEIHFTEKQIIKILKPIEKKIAQSIISNHDSTTKKILAGLAQNKLIDNVYFTFASNPEKTHGKNPLSYEIRTPSDNVLGKLHIIINKTDSMNKAKQSVIQQVTFLLLNSFIVLIFVLYFINKSLLKPIQKITNNLSQYRFNEYEHSTELEKQKVIEIAKLAKVVNTFLAKINQMTEQERIIKNDKAQLANKFQLLFNNANVGIGLINKKNQLIVANSTLRSLLTQEYVVNRDNVEIIEFTQHFQSPNKLMREIESFRIRHGDHQCTLNTKLRHKALAKERWVHCLLSKIEGFQGEEEDLIEIVLHDITAREQREQNIIYDAEHDMLTGLYNRRASLVKLNVALAKAMDKQNHFAILMLDLDGFKTVNDTFGHDAGDKVIVEVSRRIKQYFRGTDVVSRWGGDEFLIGFSFNPDYKEAISDIACDLLHQIQLPIAIGREQTTIVGSSIGVSLFPLHGNTARSLIEKSDMTMYKVKQNGKNDFAIYSAPQHSF